MQSERSKYILYSIKILEFALIILSTGSLNYGIITDKPKLNIIQLLKDITVRKKRKRAEIILKVYV